MNCTSDKTYTLAVPPTIAKASELVTSKTITIANGRITVKPLSTVVLYIVPAQVIRPLA